MDERSVYPKKSLFRPTFQSLHWDNLVSSSIRWVLADTLITEKMVGLRLTKLCEQCRSAWKSLKVYRDRHKVARSQIAAKQRKGSVRLSI